MYNKILFATIAAVVVMLSALLIVYNLAPSAPLPANSENTAEEDRLKELNQDALDKAMEAGLPALRAIEESDHRQGPVDAPIQMIIYSDFDCPFCARFWQTAKEIDNYFPDKVIMAFRHFPLYTHSMALPAALAAECAGEQDKFWEMHDKLFEAKENKKLTKDHIYGASKNLGLDQARFNECYEKEKYKTAVQSQYLEGKSMGLIGTPTIFINREIIPGALPFEDSIDSRGRAQEGMKSIIERHLDGFEL